ncbi:MAG: hypothetical protein EA379_08010 [Phycisphaerales bacterium]|nr:MAG: hypothetical protein EA379_08010 [Phycisphaerales bacterium]
MNDLDPAAPPTTHNADDLNFDEPAKWPKIVGIISIVLAGVGFVCGGIGTGFMFLTPGIMRTVESDLTGGVPPQVLTIDPALTAIMVFGTLWAVVLFVAGVSLLGRKPAARMMHIVYAAVAVLLTFVSTYLSMQQQQAISDWVAQNPDSEYAQTMHSEMGAMIGVAFGLALGLLWPVFLLFWFLIVKRDAAEISRGVQEVVA